MTIQSAAYIDYRPPQWLVENINIVDEYEIAWLNEQRFEIADEAIGWAPYTHIIRLIDGVHLLVQLKGA